MERMYKSIHPILCRILSFIVLIISSRAYCADTQENAKASSQISDIRSLTDKAAIERAYTAANNILKITSRTGLSKKEAVNLAIFIETKAQHAFKKYGNYLVSKKLQIPRSLERDPTTGNIFIHLGTNGVNKLGSGFHKIVTKSILYNMEKPEIVARATTSTNVTREAQLMRVLDKQPGIVESRGYTKRKDENGNYIHTIFTKLYSHGTLQRILEKKIDLSRQEKLEIALQILEGLASMHAKKIAHCDLSLHNCFVEIYNDSVLKKRKIRAVVADLGRSRYIGKIDKRPQGNSAYCGPEAIYFEDMKAKELLYADIYAAGCLLYRLWNEKIPPWVDSSFYKRHDVPRDIRYSTALSLLNRHTIRKYNMSSRFKSNKTYSPEERFERFIVYMVHPKPCFRETARKWLIELQDIYKCYCNQQ